MEKRACQNCKNDFTIEPDDFSYYEKIGVDTPRMCPECRAQLRLSFRNERVFYKRPCDKCHRDVVSMYSANKPYTVYCYDCWFSDDWDATDYAQEYDPSRPFFDQLYDVWKRVPKVGLIYIQSPGSEYTNISADNKNCYMVVESSNNEDAVHSYWIQECRDVIDTSFSSKCERTYECDDCYDSYKLYYSKGCHECRESYFLRDCRDCADCAGCINLRSKKYCIFNHQYTKEEYEEKLNELQLHTRQGVELFQDAFQKFIQDQPRKYAEALHAVDATGNYMKHVKNCHSCFHCYDAQDNKYGVHVWRNAKDCMDVDTAGRTASYIYNSINAGLEVSHQIACTVCWSSTYASYSMYAMNCDYVFGCIGLRKKKYCILNKEYSKEAYESLVARIVEEMKQQEIYGAFFPTQFSCFGYNETAAYEQFPLTKEEAMSLGFSWEETPRGTYGKETIEWGDMTRGADPVDFDATKEIFVCTSCTKNYRIIPNEQMFYAREHIPLPVLCPDCRHERRIRGRGPNKLWHRSCMNEGCTNEFETSYAPDRPEIVYCESCYQKEVI